MPSTTKTAASKEKKSKEARKRENDEIGRYEMLSRAFASLVTSLSVVDYLIFGAGWVY